jgi:F-type H+-transporting ATPase subunit gamma
VAAYLDEEVDQVEVFYNGYASAISQVVRRETLLPLQRATVLEEDPEEEPAVVVPLHRPEYEPDAEPVLKRLVPDYVEVSIYRALLESTASEHGARMTAMRQASDNASELMQDLTLQMNRARQAEITQEIMEVVAGAEGLG